MNVHALAFVVSLATIATACGDPETTDDVASTFSPDGSDALDAANDADRNDDVTPAADSVESLDDNGAEDTSTTALPAEVGDPCGGGTLCRRGTFCRAEGYCDIRNGCGGGFSLWPTSNPEDTGCLLYSDEAFGGVETTPECEVDEDCADSPHSNTCFFRVCQEGTACTTDDDCPMDEPYCSRDTVCYFQP